MLVDPNPLLKSLSTQLGHEASQCDPLWVVTIMQSRKASATRAFPLTLVADRRGLDLCLWNPDWRTPRPLIVHLPDTNVIRIAPPPVSDVIEVTVYVCLRIGHSTMQQERA